MEISQAFKALLDSPKKITIVTHHKPDADALGSSLGLAAFLEKKGHEVTVISPTDYPNFLAWMSGNDKVIVFNEGNESLSADIVNSSDVVFCLDFNSLDRINELGPIIANSDTTKVLVDHHLEPDHFADFEFSDTGAAATAELVYELIVGLGDRELIDANIANALYAGLMTDTGNFRHPSTSAAVHTITADLINLGADVSAVAKLIYDNNSLNRLKFIGFALTERLTVLKDLSTAYFAITREDLNRFNSQTGDTEGLVNYALSIAGIKMAAVIIDRSVMVKMSFRSVGDFSVNEFARKHFEGGGHKNAAGGKSELSLEDTVKKFESAANEYRSELSPELNISTDA